MSKTLSRLREPYIISLLIYFLLVPTIVFSHQLEPGFLDIIEKHNDRYAVTWKVPQVKGAPMSIEAMLPSNCLPPSAPNLMYSGFAFSAKWESICQGGIEGRTIRIDGLDRTATDVLVRYQSDNSSVVTIRLTPEHSEKILPHDPEFWDVAKTYLFLGVDHILKGIDHLLFVLALIILVRSNWNLIKTITAFTVAHSITLSAASLGYIHVSIPPVEAIIALSIVFLAVEIAKRQKGHLRLTEKKPWLIAFLFGLLHGLGFASALAATGLPQNEIPAALLTFNIGVELGQLLFIFIILILAKSCLMVNRHLHLGQRTLQIGLTATNYTIGGVAAYWFIERVAGFWT